MASSDSTSNIPLGYCQCGCGTKTRARKTRGTYDLYIKGHYSLASRFWSKVALSNDTDLCWEWQACKRGKGYGGFQIGDKCYFAHRIAWELTNGQILDGLLVCHKCDNRLCCNPNHLFLGTNLDNARDRDKKARRTAPQGENHPMHKLTFHQVEEIRKRYAMGDITMEKLGADYGIRKAHVCEIVNYKSWK